MYTLLRPTSFIQTILFNFLYILRYFQKTMLFMSLQWFSLEKSRVNVIMFLKTTSTKI